MSPRSYTRPTASPSSWPRLSLGAFAAGVLLVSIFATTVVHFRTELRDQIHQKIIERDAAVLYPIALQQLADLDTAEPNSKAESDLLFTLLKNAQLDGMLAVTIFDAQGVALATMPSGALLLAELSPVDYPRLLGFEKISRYHPQFSLDRYFRGVAGSAKQKTSPVLEVLLPLHRRQQTAIVGFAQYYIDARALSLELATINERIDRQTFITLMIGAALILVVVVGAYWGLRKAQRVLDERNRRLAHTNFELTLSAKASALGQITSHLIHGLQGPVAGLRAVVSAHGDATEWQSAVNYTDRMQALIEETVAMLGDHSGHATYELSGPELAAIILDRNAPLSAKKGVVFSAQADFEHRLDSHRGGLVCLIANNLIQNAVEATPAGSQVQARLTRSEEGITLTVRDEGSGIPETLRPHLFEPGWSSRPGGTGLGLAISRLLARQIGASLTLVSTSSCGTVFSLTFPQRSKIDEMA